VETDVLHPADRELAGQLRVAVMRLSRRLRQEAGQPATPSQLSALATILRAGPLTIGRLAAVERVRPPTMTRIVAALEESGLVERRTDPADRRVCLVSATEAGQAFAEETRSRRDAWLAGRLAELDPAHRAQLVRTLGLLEELAGDPLAAAQA
jgi:DNA-binding MarR family transcriptional regulator